ncbi:MAG: hypothetical protein ACYDAG_16785, partial [Chloroflexota bacterium]
LDRCIARAVREYSFAWPRLQGFVMPCSPGVRAYPLPVPSALAVPAMPGLSAGSAAGTLPAGSLFVRVTACTANSETEPSAEASLALAPRGLSVVVDVPAVAGADFSAIYAGLAAGGEYWNGRTVLTGPGAYTITELSPVSTSLPATPAAANAGLPLLLSEPVGSIAGWWVESVEFPVGAWPPHFVPFEEQGGLFILNVDGDQVPRDPGQVMNLIYAGIHQLDGQASTVPDQDWDVVALGSYGYACLQYGLPAADNFQFQDGELRDRVDDSMVPGMWRQYGQDALAVFRRKLEDIRHRRDFAAAAVAQWGDIPRRWDRL